MTQKSAKKALSIPFLTPWFTCRYPKISKADTEGKFADGKFKTDGILEDRDIPQVRAVLTAAAQKFWPDVAEEDLRLPLKEFFESKDGPSAGWGLTLKSKYRPAVFDAKKNKLPEGVLIGGGTIARVAAQIFPWSKEERVEIREGGKKRMESVTTYGVGLRLNDVQVRELVQYASQGDGSAFEETEGFEYDSGSRPEEGNPSFGGSFGAAADL